ncbi:Uncharacterised protein [Vibrio cholerae]|nr:Uncharacterised protein [Vibrio cholerae]
MFHACINWFCALESRKPYCSLMYRYVRAIAPRARSGGMAVRSLKFTCISHWP